MRGKDPKKAKPQKPKMAIFGNAGVGKTMCSLDFPHCYFIDAEGGANLPHYTDRLKKAGALYLGPEDGASDPEVIVSECKELATTKHDRLTTVLDSYSHVWNNEMQREYQRLVDRGQSPEGFFGRDKKPAIAWTRRLMSWIDKLDMNVILICHAKDEWRDQKVVRRIFDGYDKLEYHLNLILEMEKQGPRRLAKVIKSRFAEFPEGDVFEWSYKLFADRFGIDTLEASSKPIQLAAAAQVAELTQLIEAVRVDADTLDKWRDKAEVDHWSEMDADTIQKCIDYLKNKLPKSAA